MSTGPHVVIKLEGGIGNLLFQFAAGQDIEITTGLRVCYTEAKVGNVDRLRSYVGDIVSPAPSSLTRRIMAVPTSYTGGTNYLLLGLRELFRRLGLQIDIPAHDSLNWSELLPRKSRIPVGISGYFQSPDSIPRGIESVIERLDRNLEQTSAPDGILHLRRGDYTSLGWALGDDYYENGLRNWGLEVGSRLRIIGDDSLAVRGLSALAEGMGFQVFPNEKQTAREDFSTLSSCPFQILSNSSFSWWGAALAARRFGLENVTQVAPASWTPNTNSEVMLMSHWRIC